MPTMLTGPSLTIADYAGLQTAVAAFMNRTDLTGQIPVFIAMAEATLNLRLRTNEMLAPYAATQAAGTKSVTVPIDWCEFDTLAIGAQMLTYVSPAQWSAQHQDGNPSKTTTYTIMGRELYTVGALAATDPAVSISGTYYKQLPPVAQQVTWLLSTHPEAYLYGALASGWQYVLDEQRAAQNAALFGTVIDAMNAQTIKQRHSGSMWRQAPR